MIRAYHDPALRHAITRDGSWTGALEFVCARGGARTKTVYVHNPTGVPVVFQPVTPSAPGFIVSLPASVRAEPGVTSFQVTVTAGALPLPIAIDFTITAVVDASRTGFSGYADLAYSDLDFTAEGFQTADLGLKIEATAFCLPVGDERFADLNPSPLASVAEFTDYLASGMGFVDAEYRDAVVAFMADHLRDWSVWALNKHYLFDARYGPMRFAKARADSIGYAPPGVPNFPPRIRRRVYARAYEIARKHGSAGAIRAILDALEVPPQQIEVMRSGFTWHVRVPQWVAAVYDLGLLADIVLYHVDPYCDVDLRVHEGTLAEEYSENAYHIEAGPSYQGVGNVTYHGEPVTYQGDAVVYDPPEGVLYQGEQVTYDGEDVTY